MPVLRANRLSKRFGSRLLFREMTFSVEDGGLLAVIGANGSGKSTLLRILAGVLTPSAGSASLYVDGRRVLKNRHPLHVGLVAPYLNVYDGFTARENLLFIARARRIPDAKARTDEILDFVTLLDRSEDLVATYSSGMKQRIKFAAALLPEPQLLLLDEPGANLDAAGIQMVERVVGRQRESGGLVVLATNDQEEAERCENLLRIEEFR
jgi:heme exporter protein A